jgi:hypothetical protein
MLYASSSIVSFHHSTEDDPRLSLSPKLSKMPIRVADLAFDLCVLVLSQPMYTDKKSNQIFLIYKEIQSGAVAKSYMRKGFLIYEEMRKYFPIYEIEEAVSHI